MQQIFKILLILNLATFSFANDKNKPKSEEGTKPVNGVRLYYKIIGSGEPIVILHGGPGLDHTYLLPQMQALAKTHKLIFYDQRGTGGSVAPVDTNSITMENFVEDLEGMRKVFKLDRMNLFGHSAGTTLALFYAVKYPHRLRSLILANAPGASTEFFAKAGQTQQQRLSDTEKAAYAKLTQSEDFKNRTPAAMEELFRILFRVTFYDRQLADSLTLKFSPNTAKNMALIAPLLFRKMPAFDLHPQLAAITCPVLIIHGDYEAIPREAPQKIQAQIKNSQFVLLKNCGHFPYIEVPAEFFKAVKEFLSQK